MLKRAFWLSLILILTQLSTGCYCCWNRPFLFRRCGWQPAGCGFGTTCCNGPEIAPMATDYGPPPFAPGGTTMPPATPLTRR